MRHGFLVIVWISVTGCATPPPAYQAPPTTYQAPPAQPSAIEIVRDRWITCIYSSFRVNRASIPDKNAAAELAFQACRTEEEAIYAIAPSQNTLRLVAARKLRIKADLLQLP